MPSPNHYRRLRTLRRAAIVLLLPLLLVLTLRLIWGREAAHRLAKITAELQKMGILLDESAISTPEDQDPGAALDQALKAITLNSAEEKLIAEGDGNTSVTDVFWSDAHKPEVRQIIEKNQSAFRWIDTAATRDGRPTQRLSFGQLKWVRSLTDLLNAAAIMGADDHRDSDALRDLRRILVISQIVDQERVEINSQYSHLIACTGRVMAALGLERIEPTLRLTDVDGSVQEARQLLHALTDMDDFRKNATRAYDADFGWEKNWFETELGSNAWWIRPLRMDEEARALHVMELERAATQFDNWPQTDALFRSFPEPKTNLEEITVSISDEFNSPYMYMMMHFRAVVDSSAATVLLATRLYQSTHGRLPESIVPLIPDFLPAMPVDPYSPKHEPLRYRLDADGPTLWSVGENQTDEGGIVQFETYGKIKRRWGSGSSSQPDIIFGAAWTRTNRPALPRPPLGPMPGPPGPSVIAPATQSR